MSSKKIIFIADSYTVNPEDHSTDPAPTSKTLPEWYKKANRHYKDPSGNSYKDENGNNVSSWKSCPAMYDTMSAGYVFRTPCDIEFGVEHNAPYAKVLDEKFVNFIQVRPIMPEFQVPYGYHASHFAWWGEWAIKLPDGYSAIYCQPFNRNELPFLTTQGIVDSDTVNIFGTVPFFLAKDYPGGIVPAGTPFLQIFPFKREDWKAEYKYPSHQEIYNDNMANIAKFRVPEGGVYLKNVWKKRKYE
jgi:hypothetical protein